MHSSKVGASYVALALSQDGLMGDDSVIECVRDGNAINAFASFTTSPRSGVGSSPRDEVRNKFVDVDSGLSIDGVMIRRKLAS